MEGDDAYGRGVNVEVYLGLSKLGGLLWDQEIRALLRLSGLDHPALPELLAGGYQTAEAAAKAGVPDVDGVAFVATEGADLTLADVGSEVYRKDPLEALRQFEHLADGLAVLHDVGLSHRNLWPGAVDHARDRGGGQRLRLARFELSAFVSNLLSGTAVDSLAAREEVRRLVLGQGADPLPYLPPERLRFLLPLDGETQPVTESAKADVYGLGAIVWEWFVGPFPGGLPREIPDGADGVREAREALDRHGDHLRTALARADVPKGIRELLLRMLHAEPDGRPTAEEVVNELSETHEANVVELGAAVHETPYLVAFMPDKCDETLGRWQWLEFDADTPEGIHETIALLKEDLKGAVVVHSKDGAEPYVDGGETAAKREATTALLGTRAVWFCQIFRRNVAHGRGEQLPEVLLIKYVARRDSHKLRTRLDDLKAGSRERHLPEITLFDYRVPGVRMDAMRRERPSWVRFLETVTPVSRVSERELDYQRAIDWLLQYQGVELQARRYPYKLDPDAAAGPDGHVLAYWDRTRDRDRIYKQALLTKYASYPDLRPDFGDFFGRLESEDSGSADVEVYPGDSDRKDSGVQGIAAEVVRGDGRDRVILRRKPGQPKIPSSGWIRPADDSGSEAVLARQAEARWELFAMRQLTRQLRTPTAVRTLPDRWKKAGDRLLEGGAKAVQDILTHEPFFALQGPPGTGKTTVTSRAIAAYLQEWPTHRILVSAQSNFTLDNLAARILKDIGARDDKGPTDRRADVPIALRIVSQRGTPDETVKPWLRDDLAVRRFRQMRAHVDGMFAKGLDEGLRPVFGFWRGLLDEEGGESVLAELADRLQRGANIVFATCATATTRNLGATGAASSFDWVVVEEAAKAWPTELAIPLVRGTRWTLIGDHFQLPAHRRDEVVRFLDACVGDPNAGISIVGDKRHTYIDAFDLFRSLFEPKPGPASVERPTAMLSTQFRMREPIAQVISRVFYPREPAAGEPPPEDGLPSGGLATHHNEEPSPLRAPHWLRERALVWVDTDGLAHCEERPYWKNEGEAELINSIVSSMEPRPVPGRDGYTAEPLAVLTPYRQQADVLRRYGDLAPHVQTIHAFQGREADIVVVSLVRNKTRGAGGAAESYGHLSRPDLVNVMFSRARRLLVIVGDYQHFARYEDGRGDFWRQVCQAVDHYGHIHNASDVLRLEEL
ncbi:AAA domain-containing protein [Spirillospora sp. NPDC029432]|uniref:AAA domain-containing protein n=1 Tax=Spirillospora sp. NPDC029432 TaxID=3154599 RepID=UPI0034514A83